MATAYDTDLDRNAANFQPLTPLSFLARAAGVYPEQTAIIHGKRSWTYREFFARAKRLASALRQARHQARRYGRRDAAQYAGDAGGALRCRHGRRGAQLDQHPARCRHHRVYARPRRGQGADRRPRILQGGQRGARGLQGEAAGDRLRRSGILRSRRTARRSRIRGFPAPRRRRLRLADAGRRMGRDCAELYVGTTGDPKGVVYHHRGAYLLAMANVITCAMGKHPVYLWTLPMFHCNGWCFPWTLVGGCGHSRVPAGSSRGADLRRHRHPQGDASVRRADRDVDLAQRDGCERSRCPTPSSSSPPQPRRRNPCWRR